MNKKGKKAIAVVTLMSLILTATLSTFPVKAAVGHVTRTSGADRYSTAAQVATANWTTNDNVVLVSGEGYADAVSASALSKKLDAPILLTTPSSLNSDTANALTTLKPKNIYVVGGNASVSQAVRSQLKVNYNLIELGGTNRYETNAAVAEKLVQLGVDPSNVMMVGGEGFSDALSTAPIAAASGQILLLGTNSSSYIKPVIDFVQSHNSKVTIVGTQSIINDTIYNAVNAVTRIDGGQDRFDTNLKILNYFKDKIRTDKLYVANASGYGYPDALVASVLAGKYSAPLILTDTDRSLATDNAIAYIKANATMNTDLNVIGGKGVVSDEIVNAINDSVTPPPFSGNITSVEAVDNQTVDIKINDQILPFTVNGGQSVSISDIVNAGYSIKFVTDSPVFAYDPNTSKSQTSVDGVIDRTALTSFYYGSTTNTSTINNDHFKYQVQIYKNNALVALSSLTRVNIINGDTTASSITDYTIKLLAKNTDGNYININTGDREAATKHNNLATKVASGKLVLGEKASVSNVRGILINGGTNVEITNVKFYSSNPFVASIDETSGIITTNGIGDFILTIKSGNQIKNIPMSVVNDSRKVTNATANVSSITMGKGTSSSFYLTLMDQYGDTMQGNAVVPNVSAGSIVNGIASKNSDYQLQYVSNSTGNPIAYEKVVAETDCDGKAAIKIINDSNTPNTGDGILKITNNSGLTILTLPISVNSSSIVSTTKLEAVKDGKSEALTLDLDPQAASDNNNEFVKINLNRYSIDGTSLGTVDSTSSDYGKFKFYITQDPNNKIVDDSTAVDKTLIPVSMNSDGTIIITTPYGIVDQGFTGSLTSTITPDNSIVDNRNIINVAHTGKITLIAKSYDPVTNTEGQIKSLININVQDSSPSINSIQFESNLQASIPSTSTGGDIINFNIRDILREANIKINGSAGDGKVRIANNGAIFMNYHDGTGSAINNIQNGDPSYDPSADILLGYIVAAPMDSDISYTTVNTDGTILAKLAPGKVSGKFTVGVRRAHESVPFTTTTITIAQ